MENDISISYRDSDDPFERFEASTIVPDAIIYHVSEGLDALVQMREKASLRQACRCLWHTAMLALVSAVERRRND